MPATASGSAPERCSDNDVVPDTDIVPDPAEHLDVPLLAHPQPWAATERMATKGELARIRYELDVSVD